MSLAASALFCTPAKPWLCGSVWTQVSAAVVALGAAMWVTAQPGHSVCGGTEAAARTKRAA